MKTNNTEESLESKLVLPSQRCFSMNNIQFSFANRNYERTFSKVCNVYVKNNKRYVTNCVNSSTESFQRITKHCLNMKETYKLCCQSP